MPIHLLLGSGDMVIIDERTVKVEKAYIYDTKLGKIFITQNTQGITEVSLFADSRPKVNEKLTTRNTEYEIQETVLIKETAEQLMEYFEGKRKEFNVPLDPQGTEFQKKVWDSLRTIPYGETRSYKQIAAAIGNIKASRAVGMANHNNPIMFIIPCHRVIGIDGKLVGYAGGLQIKEHLLSLEKSIN